MFSTKVFVSTGVSLESESISRGVLYPGVVLWALLACVQSVGLARQFPGVERARVGQGTQGLALHSTFVFPLLEISHRLSACWVLHPLNDLELCDKIDLVIVGGQDEVHPVCKDLDETFVGDEPGGIEGEGERGPVGFIVVIEVLYQEVLEL